MPEPMVALPCGSRSTTRVRRPSLARPAARFTVVVVLPTPPFWFATQKTRIAELALTVSLLMSVRSLQDGVRARLRIDPPATGGRSGVPRETQGAPRTP